MLEARFHKSCFDEIAVIKNGKIHLDVVAANSINWYTDSPDAGDPNCICSWCGKLISEDELPLRLFNEGRGG